MVLENLNSESYLITKNINFLPQNTTLLYELFIQAISRYKNFLCMLQIVLKRIFLMTSDNNKMS